MSLVVKRMTANWCQPCKMLAPILEELKPQYPSVSFQVFDVDDNPEIAQQYQVRNIPLVIFEKDGKEVERMVGVQSRSTYIEILDEWK